MYLGSCVLKVILKMVLRGRVIKIRDEKLRARKLKVLAKCERGWSACSLAKTRVYVMTQCSTHLHWHSIITFKSKKHEHSPIASGSTQPRTDLVSDVMHLGQNQTSYSELRNMLQMRTSSCGGYILPHDQDRRAVHNRYTCLRRCCLRFGTMQTTTW